jgi:Zn-finger nucleic acid-binding protein
LKCPICDVPLRVIDRRGIEIDVCPECRGVWLERGELEKFIAAVPESEFGEAPARPAASPQGGYQPQQPQQSPYPPQGSYPRDDSPDSPDRRPGYYESGRPGEYREGDPRRRRKSWLSDFFEFGGD